MESIQAILQKHKTLLFFFRYCFFKIQGKINIVLKQAIQPCAVPRPLFSIIDFITEPWTPGSIAPNLTLQLGRLVLSPRHTISGDGMVGLLAKISKPHFRKGCILSYVNKELSKYYNFHSQIIWKSGSTFYNICYKDIVRVDALDARQNIYNSKCSFKCQLTF